MEYSRSTVIDLSEERGRKHGGLLALSSNTTGDAMFLRGDPGNSSCLPARATQKGRAIV